MEHRLSERTTLDTHVAIYYNSLGLLQAKAINLSRHGMFVRTGRLSLPLHALIEVAFPLGKGEQRQPLRTKAMVVRIADDGIGLMFADEMEAMEVDQQLPRDIGEEAFYKVCAG